MLETAGHFFRPPPSTWADPARAGGYGWGQLSHGLAWVYHVCGLRPKSVFALSAASPAGVDYYDAAAVRMENGALLALSGAATAPKDQGFQLDIRIFGDEGMLLFDVERDRMLQTKGGEGVINMEAQFAALRDAGYDGALALEFVHQDYMATLYDDVLTETVAMRDRFRAWATGEKK